MISSPLASVKKPKRVMAYREQALQIQCVAWFDRQYPALSKHLIHIPNGGRRVAKTSRSGRRYSPEAQRLKLMGVRAGVADLLLAYPRLGVPGLWIEMKSETGRASPAQKEFLESMVEAGYRVAVCSSFEDFMEIIKSYLGKPL